MTSSVQSGPAGMPRRAHRLALAAALAGAVAFILGLIFSPQRSWQIYHVNFLFWTGLAQGGVAMAAVYRLTNARWGDQFRRIGESMVAFLPVTLVLFALLAFSGSSLFPWMHEEVHGKEVWLNPVFVFLRDGLLLLVLTLFSLRYVYHAIRPVLGVLRERQGPLRQLYLLRLTAGWSTPEAEREQAERQLARLTPGLLILFVSAYTLLGFDLVMSMDPHWYSTIYGWMFTLHAFYAALTAIVMLGVLGGRRLGFGSSIQPGQWHDMGRFLFGFALLSGGFFWSQFLVIWYGNVPEETVYLKERFYQMPWEPLMWVYIAGAYLFPLLAFLSAQVKRMPGALAGISALLISSLFIERLISVVPFAWHEPTIPFGFLEAGVTAGFLGLFLLIWFWFAERIPLVSPGAESTASVHHAELEG